MELLVECVSWDDVVAGRALVMLPERTAKMDAPTTHPQISIDLSPIADCTEPLLSPLLHHFAAARSTHRVPEHYIGDISNSIPLGPFNLPILFPTYQHCRTHTDTHPTFALACALSTPSSTSQTAILRKQCPLPRISTRPVLQQTIHLFPAPSSLTGPADHQE